MANYAASVLAEAKLILADRYASPEKRLKTSGVIGAFLKNTELAIPNVGELRTSESRAEKGYLFNRAKRANTAGRTHNHTGAVADSAEVPFTWKTFADKAQTSLKRSENNLFSDAQILANELDNMFKNIHESIDSDALSHLTTNTTQVNKATANGTFDNVEPSAGVPPPYVWEIAAGDILKALQYAKSMLRQNYYKGGAEAILDPVLYAQAEYAAAQGVMNGTNYGFQMNGLNVSEAVGYSDSGYTKGLGLFIPEGSIGAVDWIPAKNRQGYGDYESVLGGYGTIQDPITGLTFAVHGYSQRADTSAAGGDTQDVVTEWEVSVDMSFNNSPLSVAGETTIFEVGIV